MHASHVTTAPLHGIRGVLQVLGRFGGLPGPGTRLPAALPAAQQLCGASRATGTRRAGTGRGLACRGAETAKGC